MPQLIAPASPYVYSVHADDLPALAAAVEAALATPIDSFVPPNMKFDWVSARMAEVVEGDWRSRGAVALEEWRKEGKSWEWHGPRIVDGAGFVM